MSQSRKRSEISPLDLRLRGNQLLNQSLDGLANDHEAKHGDILLRSGLQEGVPSLRSMLLDALDAIQYVQTGTAAVRVS